MEVMVWIAATVILIAVEVFTLGLTTIWFAAGALLACLAAVLHLHVGIQVAIFIVVSIVLLVFTRPWAVKYLNSRTTKTNAEAIVGKKVRVIKDINNLKGEGQVSVGGIEWTARSFDETVTFKAEDIVRVIGIEGVKLIVEPVQKGE